MINFASNLNKMIDAGLGGPMAPPRTEVAVGHRVVYTEVSGAVASFETNVIAPVKNLRVTMEPIQDLHGYDNPWPAGGGKNIVSFPYSTTDGTYIGVTFATDSIGKITASGTTTGDVNFVLVRNGELPAGTYTLSIKGNHMGSSLLLRDLDASVMVAQIVPGSTDASITFTVSEDISQYNLYFNTSAIGTDVNISAYVQLESGSAATEYTPYSNICPITGRNAVTIYRSGEDMSSPQSATVQLGQTVYGGTVDVTTGVMTVDMAYSEMQTAKTSDWQKSSLCPGGFYIGRSTFKIDGIPLKDNTPFLCSHAKSVSRLADYVYGTCYCDSSLNFRLMDGSATVSDWVAYLQEQKNNGTPVVVCGLLATPLTIPLTAEQMSTLTGQNNVWSDADSVTLEYPYYEETEGY